MARVILVDDDDLGRRRLRHELEYMGHAVHETMDGAAALSAVGSEAPDLVITTIFMRHGQGLEVIRLLQDEHPTLPIVVLSSPPAADGPVRHGAARGAVAADVVQTARELGAGWVLASPFDWVEFRDAVDTLCSHARERIRGEARATPALVHDADRRSRAAAPVAVRRPPVRSR
jgi:CheY-like chemotaxis protein